MNGEFLTPQDPRWTKYLQTCCHDFYHLPEYVALCAKYEGATPVAFYAENEEAAFLAPLLIRPTPNMNGSLEGWYDATAPYGYPTPLVNPPQASVEVFLQSFRFAASQRSLVTAFFRLHPFLQLNHDSLGKFGRLVHHGQTVFIDLSKSAEEIRGEASQNHKRNIRRLLNLGFTVILDAWELLNDFATIYWATMRRVGAIENYLFAENYFKDLRAALRERVHLCCVRSPKGDIASAGLFIETNGIVQYHLGGTADEYLALAPSKLMFDFMPRWAHGRKHIVFHLGGGVGAVQDPLFQFKAGFSKDRADFFTFRMILDEEKYHLLNQLVQVRCPDQDPTGGHFFPEYRQQVHISHRAAPPVP